MWKVLGGSVLGRAHASSALPCQDASGWHVSDVCSCLAVADGAGSRPQADVGAQRAVAEVLRWAAALKEPPLLEDLQHAFELAKLAVERAASTDDAAPQDFACTLAVAVMTDAAALFGLVGDSLAFARDDEGELHTIEAPGRGEYLNETTFLTSAELPEILRLTSLADVPTQAIALATDGLQFKILENVRESKPYTPFFEDAFAWAAGADATSEGLQRFIDELDDQSGDDKTLLLAVRVAETNDGDAHASRDPDQSAAPTA